MGAGASEVRIETRVEWKHGAWHDAGSWELHLQPIDRVLPSVEPVAFGTRGTG